MDLHFDFTEVRKMASTYTGGAKIVLDETRKGIQKSVIQIEADAKRLVPTDTHNLQRTITHEVTTQGTNVIGRAGTNSNYGKIVEDGRTPGRMPPPGALLGWMRRHGIDARYEFVVARSINRRKRPRPYLKPALAKNRAAITREMDQVLRRVAQRLAAAR